MMIFETSWEVCNKMGGIYTVLSSRAREMMTAHKGEVYFVGPLFEDLPQDFIPTPPDSLRLWVEGVQASFPLRTAVGKWAVPGEPPVVLVDFSPLWEEKNTLYYDMWQSYGIEGDKGYGDYDASCLFAIAASRVMHSLIDTLRPRKGQAICIYNEWQTAMGLLYSKALRPNLKTMFLTHATTVGRSIAGNGKELYAYMPYYNGDQMAAELGVWAKHSVEKRAAHESDIFATVSRLTADECERLIERKPVVLPNGFEGDFVPQGRKYTALRREARQSLARIAEALTGKRASDKDVFVSIAGRYEYRNKGIDLFVDSIAKLRGEYKGKKRIWAFILVPAWVAEPRADLSYILREGLEATQSEALQHPTLTHWLHNMQDDATQSHFRYLGLDSVSEHVNIIHIPVYLTGQDGIVDKSYYDLLLGMDLSVYPSYYEPWGYTPLESIAFGVPTITTRYAGFGLWAEEEMARDAGQSHAVQVLARTDHNAEEISRSIAELIQRYAEGRLGTTAELRKQCFTLAERAEWKHFYKHYLSAYKGLRK